MRPVEYNADTGTVNVSYTAAIKWLYHTLTGTVHVIKYWMANAALLIERKNHRIYRVPTLFSPARPFSRALPHSYAVSQSRSRVHALARARTLALAPQRGIFKPNPQRKIHCAFWVRFKDNSDSALDGPEQFELSSTHLDCPSRRRRVRRRTHPMATQIICPATLKRWRLFRRSAMSTQYISPDRLV